MKRKLFCIVCFIMLLVALGACASQTTDGEDAVVPAVMTLKGPTGVEMAKMIDSSAESNAYDFRVAGSPDEIVAALSSKEADIAAMPTNLAAKLYAKNDGDIEMLAIIAYGSLYLLEAGDSVNALTDLRGKTVYLAGQGSNPQYILEYLVNSAGLIPGEDIDIVYKSEHAEVATLLAGGEIDLAVLPEPNVSAVLAKNDNIRIALDFNREWMGATGENLTMSCVVANREFVEAHPQAVADFLDALNQSISYALENPVDTAELCATYGIIDNPAVVAAAIPNMGLTFIKGEEMEPALSSYFTVLLTADPASIGGAMPGEDFYFKE